MDVAVSNVLVTGATPKVIPARCFQCRAEGGNPCDLTVRVVVVYWLPCRVDCSRGCMSTCERWAGPFPYGGWPVGISPYGWGIKKNSIYSNPYKWSSFI